MSRVTRPLVIQRLTNAQRSAGVLGGERLDLSVSSVLDINAHSNTVANDNWVDNLPAVAWADRITTRFSTGKTAFYLGCGREAVLLIEMEFPTWKILPWDKVHTTADLLAMRACQLQRPDEDLAEAALYLQRSREAGKKEVDSRNRFAHKRAQRRGPCAAS